MVWDMIGSHPDVISPKGLNLIQEIELPDHCNHERLSSFF